MDDVTVARQSLYHRRYESSCLAKTSPLFRSERFTEHARLLQRTALCQVVIQRTVNVRTGALLCCQTPTKRPGT
ncbi:hypothetical protein RB4902 [Rhodopirellula baltica SH 1]|uniref:Uncharacterized protein n=1 Tax=Rhodopirellula baltica (strain DSM 10527 / NCIMB 13988 / SH1) TaxID=243090 RepID=Q7UH15_RHOBA|nr:hypothetical protein RB4902 [Rhodopirellula baltica SH 1]